MQKIKKGDTVEVITGKDRGQRGQVERVWPREGKVLVAGINLVTKHQRGTQDQPGGIIEKPAPLNISNIMLVCPQCDLRTRVGIQRKGETKVRACKKCGKFVDK